MIDFLNFLNTADAEALKKLPGITPSQADGILAARPFESLQDCKRVQSLTEKRLMRLQAVYQEQNQPSEITEPDVAEPVFLEPVVLEPVIDEASIETKESVNEPEAQEVQPKPSRSSGKVGRILVRILVVLLIFAALAAAVYWGVPYLYEKYIRPVENNTASITDLSAAQAAEVVRLDDEIAALQARISTLELRADNTDQALKTHDATLARLEEMQTTLDQKLAAQKDDLLAQLSEQVKLTRGIELLSRSRLYLSQSNYGLAKEDLQSSRDLLYSMLASLPADQVGAMNIVIDRIDMALENLPVYPVVAVFDVDTAWQYLVDGLPNVPAQATTPVVLPPTETPVPTATVDITAEPTSEPATPTP